MSISKKQDSGVAEGAGRATEPSPESLPAVGAGRWSSRRKVSVIVELLRGADLESTSRKYRVTVATLTEWRDRFLTSGEAGLHSREVDVEDEEKRRLKSVVANLSIDNELLHEKSAAGEQSPFGVEEVETMSRTLSTSSNKPYGVARATAVWGLARSSYYARRKCAQEPRIQQKRGPKRLADEELVGEIRQVLEESVFHGEGYRKVWARLRHKNVRAWRDRVLRVMREHQLLSPNYVADVGAHGSPNQPEVLCATVHCCKSTGEGLRSSTELPCAYAP